MLSDILKEQTKSAHQELEKIFVSKIRSISSLRDYAEMLELLYGFYKPLEDRVNSFIDQSLLPDHNDRRKSLNMLKDIGFLKSEAASIQVSTGELPVISNHQQAIGALYVLEGSTLGGAIICKMIGSKLQLSNEDGLSYFFSYGDATHAMWRKFKDAIDKPALTAEQQSEVINAANETFNGLKMWIQHAK